MIRLMRAIARGAGRSTKATPVTRCLDDQTWLDYRDGLLDPERTQRLSSHISQCETCLKKQALMPSESRPILRKGSQRTGRSASAQLQDEIVRRVIRRVLASNRYRAVERFREGGMGIILKAELITGAKPVPVILKVYDEQYLQFRQQLGPDASIGLQRFLREADVGLALDHPHIIHVRDCVKIDDIHLIEMEPVSGISLVEYVQTQGKLSERTALAWAEMLGQAMEHYHGKSIVHRDIKPLNCLVDVSRPRKAFWLIDFGVARDRNSTATAMTILGQMLGTDRFCSHQQRSNPSEADIRDDLYSLGMTLAWALSEPEVWQAYHGVPEPTLRTVSKPIRRLLRKLTEFKREYRYQSPAELLEELPRIKADLAHVEGGEARRKFLRSVGVGAGAATVLGLPAGYWIWTSRASSLEREVPPPPPPPAEIRLDAQGTIFASELKNFSIEGEFRFQDRSASLTFGLRLNPEGQGIALVVPASSTDRIRLVATRPGGASVLLRDTLGDDFHLAETWLPFRISLEDGVGDFRINGVLVLHTEVDLPDQLGEIRLSGKLASIRGVVVSPGLAVS